MLHKNRFAKWQSAGSGAVMSATAHAIRALADELRSRGLEIDEPTHCLGDSICGNSFGTPASSRHAQQATVGTLASRISQALNDGVPVTIDVSGKAADPDQFETFCRDLGEQGVSPSPQISLYCEAPAITLRAFAIIACCYFGDGRRYVGLPSPSSLPACDWRYLWQRAHSRWAVLPVYADSVRAGSPLLSDEPACSVLPSIGLKVPRNSAWLPLRLRLERFADVRGKVREDALERALQAAVHLGERLLDTLRWTPGPMRDDARRNRRIAIQLDGIGDLACMQCANPGDLAVQRDMRALLLHIRAQLQLQSATLAAVRGACPAISTLNPALQTTDPERRRTWSDRWQSALERHAVRHRNLLAISPYAVIPKDTTKRAAWADLLPLIGIADSFGFAPPRLPEYWGLPDYKAFHCRAAAQIARRNDNCVVATRV